LKAVSAGTRAQTFRRSSAQCGACGVKYGNFPAGADNNNIPP